MKWMIIAGILPYLMMVIVSARKTYRIARPFTMPISCKDNHGDRPHVSMCYWQGYIVSVQSAHQAVAISLFLGLFWPLIVIIQISQLTGWGLKWVVTAGNSAMQPEEAAAHLAELEAADARYRLLQKGKEMAENG